MIDLEELERVASEATPGPWRWGDWSAVFGTVEDPDRMDDLEVDTQRSGPGPRVRLRGEDARRVLRIEDRGESPRDAVYIAAASPDVVLALIERVRAAETLADVAMQWRYEGADSGRLSNAVDDYKARTEGK